jgi:hypothetical protein
MNLRRSFLLRSLLRRFLFFLFALALSPSPPLLAQSTAKTFTLTAANQCATIGVTALPTVGIYVSGTFSMTLQPEVSINGSTPQNSQVTPSTSTTPQSTITTTGNYLAAVGGYDSFLLCVSSYSSGSATVVLNPSPALNAGLIGGAAGSATAAALNGVYAANGFGLHDDGRFILDVSTSLSSPTVTCPNNDCNFTAADNGKICFATNMTQGGGPNFRTAKVILGQATLTVLTSQTANCGSSNANTAVSAAGVFIWGSDDTTPLKNAFTQALGSCSGLILPGTNSQGTGPAAMLVQAAEFGYTGTMATNANCSLGVGESGRGMAVRGQGERTSYVIPTPNFDPTTCTFGPNAQGCFFGTPDGYEISDFTIWGGGNANPGSGFNGKTAVNMGGANWVYAHDMQFLGWGAGNTNGIGGAGIYIAGLYAVLDHVNLDGFGGGNGSSAVLAGGATEIIGGQFWDVSGNLLEISSAIPTPVQTFGNTMGDAFTGKCVVKVDNFSTWNSYGDIIGYDIANPGNLICASTAGYVMNLSGDSLATNTTGITAISNPASTGIVRLQNTTISVPSGTAINNVGSYFDLGGNQILSATTPYTGAGNVFGSLSITGTVQTSGNVALTGFGSSPSVGTVSGDSRLEQFTITIGSTPTTGSMVVTFPTPFLTAPICNAPVVAGTNTTLGYFTPGTISATSAAFTYVGTLVGADTLVVQVACQ